MQNTMSEAGFACDFSKSLMNTRTTKNGLKRRTYVVSGFSFYSLGVYLGFIFHIIILP